MESKKNFHNMFSQILKHSPTTKALEHDILIISTSQVGNRIFRLACEGSITVCKLLACVQRFDIILQAYVGASDPLHINQLHVLRPIHTQKNINLIGIIAS